MRAGNVLSARAYAIHNPELARRERDEGHTIAYHTFDHPSLDRMPLGAAEVEIDRAIIAVNSVVYGQADASPVAPFFRFPGFASSNALLDRLNSRAIVIFGADLWASDWNSVTPAQELQLVMTRMEAEGGGIILFHDTKFETAAMLPALLKELKDQGYRVIHVVPARGPSRPPIGQAKEFFFEKRGKTMEKQSKRNVRANASLYSIRLTFGS
jgi:peptidoglycan-N-acetylglucosamine deacetylase